MPYYCTVPRCTSMAGKAKNVSFHQFPRDQELARIWNNILKRGKPYTKYSKVCSLHFRPEDYTITSVGKNKGQWRTLRKDAIPSLNLPSESPTPPNHPAYHRRNTGAWLPNNLPPSAVDTQIQQQMAQAIYIQTMLAMQAASSDSPPLPVQNVDSTSMPAHSSNLKLTEMEQQLKTQNAHQKSDQNDRLNQENTNQVQNLNLSNQYEKNTSYKCLECSKCFKDPDVFVLHKRTHMPSLDLRERLPANVTKQEKENFHSNSEIASQDTLRANPILANLLKSGINGPVPDVSNGGFDVNSILSIENQLLAAMTVHMESYVRNLTSLFPNQPKESPTSSHSSDQNDHSPAQDGQNSSDDEISEHEDKYSIQLGQNITGHHSEITENNTYDQNSLQHDQNNLQGQNSIQHGQNNNVEIDHNNLQDHNSVEHIHNMSGDNSLTDENNLLDQNIIQHGQNLETDQNTLVDEQNCLDNENYENSPLTDQDSPRADQNSAHDQDDENSSESQGSVEPNCDIEDLNESKDSNSLVIDENV